MTTPEQNLWREVLLLTVQDALTGCTSSGTPKAAKLRATHEAQRYLTVANRDFDLVCTMADLDPVAVREAMIKQLANAPTPEALISAGAARTDPIYLTHDDQTLTIKAWSKRTGIQTATIHFRLRSGWSVARTLTTATRKRSDRGVVSDFEQGQGTGGGTAAQETPNITFQDQTT